ncbi:unnamed protein product, partial [Phyllotreta striolata]
SGVAVLSCTDCSASSSTSCSSSDITDPGSPFSTTSSHSEDSGSQPAKMPPTQTAHHPPWPWTADEGPACKRPTKTFETNFAKIVRTLPRGAATTTVDAGAGRFKKIEEASNRADHQTPRLQQGKITEYFKSQIKASRDLFAAKQPPAGKMLIDQQTQFDSLKKDAKKPMPKKIVQSKIKKVSVPRKILPAPSNVNDKLTISDQLNHLAKFTPTVTLTALSFPPNYTYIHTKGPKPNETPIFVPQYATIANVIQPFNCVKLNTTVVPIVKMPSTAATPMTFPAMPAFNIDTAIPTVLTAKTRLPEATAAAPAAVHAEPTGTADAPSPSEDPRNKSSRTEEPHRTEERKEMIHADEMDKSKGLSDSDSGISNKECSETIQVNVSERVDVEEQRSPILSKPKTIRFPAKQAEKEEVKTPQHVGDGVCRWAECIGCFDTSGALLEHLQVKHVISQSSQEHFVCLWSGCKVYGRNSCSRSWLERHVLAHAGTKPFRCIVDGCGQRFTTQLMLERHVNSHFNSDGSPNNNIKKSPENGVSKLFKRNGKKIRFRRQPWSARMFDFLDSGVMEGLQYKLLLLTQKRTSGNINEPGDGVHLSSQVLAKRIETDGSTKYLLKWHPPDIIPDEWVPEKEYKPTRVVSIPRLQPSSKSALGPSLFPRASDATSTATPATPRRKHRRKPMSKRT